MYVDFMHCSLGETYSLRAVVLLVSFCAGQLQTEDTGGGCGQGMAA